MASRDSSVNIDALLIYMEKKLEDPSPSNVADHCIYRVNQKFENINPYAYKPEMVSIGPFHRNQGRLPAMEEHKLDCLRNILKQTGKDLKEYVQPMSNLLDETRKCYAESIKLDNNTFTGMMLLDGLFIIDLFQKYWQLKNGTPQDRLLNNLRSIVSLKRDILLLENQLPMSVLDVLFDLTKTCADGSISYPINDDGILRSVTSVSQLSLQILDKLIMVKPYNPTYQAPKAKHLLDLLGKTLHPSSLDWPSKYPRTSKSVPCVTELTQAGVKFERGSSDRLLDIEFDNGIMKIPPIVVHDLTETLLRNLIAYEQCSNQRDTYVISYAYFMDSLINSEEDVEILRKQKIIVNTLGNNGGVSDLFNKLCNEVTLEDSPEDFYYSDICYKVNEYYNTPFHRNMATVKRDIFATSNSNLTKISFFAACLLLFFTLIQTLTSIIQTVTSIIQTVNSSSRDLNGH